MEISIKNLQKLKSINNIVIFPITIYDINGKALVFDGIAPPKPLPYSFPIKFNNRKKLSIQYGKFNEIFLVFPLQDVFISIGPVFNGQGIDENIVKTSTSSEKKYLKQLPVFSSSDFRDLLVIIDNLFSLHLEEYYMKYIQNLIKYQKQQLKSYNHPLQKEALKSYTTPFYLEHHLMEIMAKGDTDLLTELVQQTPLGILPIPETNDIRNEKNYCIILLEKISWFSIQMGVDIIKCLSVRNYYINEIEKQKQVMDVLTIRDSAIVYFTELLHGVSISSYSLFVRRIIQYIYVHIYDQLLLSDVAKHFFVSNSQLRRCFKNEVGISIGNYIQKQKIIVAKYLLLTQLPPCTVAKELNFYDVSHFIKIFKKHTGLTPIQFQNNERLLKE